MSTTEKPAISLESTDEKPMFEFATERLTEMLDTINPDSVEYTSHGENVGWQNTRGTATVTLTDGEDLLQKLTPNSSWNLTATLHEDMGELAIELSHHDSPTGELHVLTPSTDHG